MSFGIRNVPDRTKVGGLMDADRDVGDVGIQEVSDHQSLQVVFFLDFFGGVGSAKIHPIFTVRGRWMAFLRGSGPNLLNFSTRTKGGIFFVTSTRMKGGLKSPRKHDSTKESSPR